LGANRLNQNSWFGQYCPLMGLKVTDSE